MVTYLSCTRQKKVLSRYINKEKQLRREEMEFVWIFHDRSFPYYVHTSFRRGGGDKDDWLDSTTRQQQGSGGKIQRREGGGINWRKLPDIKWSSFILYLYTYLASQLWPHSTRSRIAFTQWNYSIRWRKGVFDNYSQKSRAYWQFILLSFEISIAFQVCNSLYSTMASSALVRAVFPSQDLLWSLIFLEPILNAWAWLTPPSLSVNACT